MGINDREPSAAPPQPNFGLSPAKALRRKGFKKKTLFRTSRPFGEAQGMLGVLARGLSESEKSSASEEIAQAANIVMYSSPGITKKDSESEY
jgi:hypothetical protein